MGTLFTLNGCKNNDLIFGTNCYCRRIKKKKKMNKCNHISTQSLKRFKMYSFWFLNKHRCVR